MEFVSAFSSLERIAIIVGAVIVGYWGFRLFASARVPGMVFMGAACVVLIAALLTVHRPVQNVVSRQDMATVTPPKEDASRATEEAVPDRVPEQTPETALDAPPAEGHMVDASIEASESQPSEHTGPVAKAIARPEMATPAGMPAATRPELLSSQELGGRIVSVKSENVTLEWTPRDDESDE